MPKDYSLDVGLHSGKKSKILPPGPNELSSGGFGFEPRELPAAPDSLSNLNQQPQDQGIDIPWYAPVAGRVVGAIDEASRHSSGGEYIPFDQRVKEYEEKQGEAPPNPFTTGLQAGFLGGFAGDVGFAETLSDIAGDVGKDKLKAAGDFLEGEAYKYPMRTVRDFDSAKDIGAYALQATGYMFGYLGSMIPTAIATGGVGAIGRVVGKEALKGLTKKEIAKTGALALGRAATGPSVIKNIGHTYRGVREETGVESPAIAIPVGVASGLLERFGIGKTFEAYFDALPDSVKEKYWRQMMGSALKAAGKSALVEGSTEAGQESLQLLANRIADSTYDIVNGENAWRILDASAMGAFGAAPIGAVGGAGNYYTAVNKKADKDLVDTTYKRVAELAKKEEGGSVILASTMGLTIERIEKKLDDLEYIPTQEEYSAIENIKERIPSLTSLSESQATELESKAQSVLLKYKDRIGDSNADKEASEAQAQADLETKSKENLNNAATQAGVDPSQSAPFGRDPRVAEPVPVLTESQAPYNNPESQYEVGQTYLHNIIGFDGNPIEVEALITKVNKNGKVLESIWADSANEPDPVPLIATRGRRTRTFRTQDEVESEQRLRNIDTVNDPKYTETSLERNAKLGILQGKIASDKEQKALEEKMAKEAGAVIRTKKKITPADLQKARDKQEARLRRDRSKTPIKRTYGGYGKKDTDSKTGKSESAKANAIKKVLEKSLIVEVPSRGESRQVGIIRDIKRVTKARPEAPIEFTAIVKFENQEGFQVTIDEYYKTSQPSEGISLVAKGGKLTKEQEGILKDFETLQKEAESAAGDDQRADLDEILTGPRSKTRSTKDASTTTETKSEGVKIVKTKEGVKAKPKAKKKTTKKTRGVSGIILTGKREQEAQNILNKIAERRKRIVDITGYPVAALQDLNDFIRLIIVDIKQAIVNAKLNKKKTYNKKDLRGAVVKKFAKEVDDLDLYDFGEHLPSFKDNPEDFVGKLFDAVIAEGGSDIENLVDKNLEEGDYNEEQAIISRMLDKLSQYVDFPMDYGSDFVTLGNVNVFKLDTDSVQLMDGNKPVSLFNKNRVKSDAVLDFSSARGLVVSIKAKGSSEVSYTLNEDGMDQIQIQRSKIKGREKVVVFAHIPKSLIVDDSGVIQRQNWEYQSKKGGPRFLEDISWVGLDREEFVTLVKQAAKSKRLKDFFNSTSGEILFSQKENLGGFISNAIDLVKDPRYANLKKDKSESYKRIANLNRSYIAEKTISDLVKLFEDAVNIHLDHFASLTEKQLGPLASERTELRRLQSYARKLDNAINGIVPKAIDLPKYGVVIETKRRVTTSKGKQETKSTFEIQNKPDNPDNFKPVTDLTIPQKDRFFSKAGQKRQSLKPEDRRYAKELLESIKKRITVLEERTLTEKDTPTDEIEIQATNLDYSSQEDLEYTPSKLRVDIAYAEDVVSRIRNYISPEGKVEGSDISNLYNEISSLYNDDIELKSVKYKSDEYRRFRPTDEAKDANLTELISTKDDIVAAKDPDADAVGEVSPADVLERSEEEEEVRKFIAGEFYEDTEIGRANKAFREARKNLIDTIQSNDLSDNKFREKIIQFQKEMLIGWNKFLELRGTDFLLFDGTELQARDKTQYLLYDLLKKENIQRMESSSVYTSQEDRIKIFVDRFNKIKEERDIIHESYIKSFQREDILLSLIAKRTNEVVEKLKQKDEGYLILEAMGWASEDQINPPTASDFTVDKILANPKSYSATGDIDSYPDVLNLDEDGIKNYIDSFTLRYGLGSDVYTALAELTDIKGTLDSFRELTKELLAISTVITSMDKKLGEQFGFDAAQLEYFDGNRYQYHLDQKENLRRSRVETLGDLEEDLIVFTKPTQKEKERSMLRRSYGDSKKNFYERSPLTNIEYTYARDFKFIISSESDSQITLDRNDYRRIEDILENDLEPKLLELKEDLKEKKLKRKTDPKWLKKTGRPKRTLLTAKEEDNRDYLSGGVKAGRKLLAILDKRAKISAESTGKFGITTRKIRKKGIVFKQIVDSFFTGGAGAMDPGVMFGMLISLSNRFSEDQFRETGTAKNKGRDGEFFKLDLKKSGRTETPATLYYKLYKTLELRDPFKILEHPAFSNSGFYLGPITPEGMTDSEFTQEKLEIRKEIQDKITEYAREFMPKNRDQLTEQDLKQGSRKYIKQIIIGSIFDEFIELFAAESGMKERSAIVKKLTGLDSNKRAQVLDYLAGSLDIPFEPRVIEDLEERKFIQDETRNLELQIGKAEEEYREAKKNRIEFGSVKTIQQRIIEQGSRTGRKVTEEINRQYREDQSLESELNKKERSAQTQLNSLRRTLKEVDSNPEILLSKLRDASSGEASLDRLTSKYLSVTLSNTLPKNYTTVKSDRPSPDLPIQKGAPYDSDALVTGVKASDSERSEEVGSAIGADGIVQLLEDNRDKLGAGFVDRAIILLSNIPEKYLKELTLSISTSLRTDRGFELGGSFVEAMKTISIPLEGKTADSFVHEFSHYLHAFIPQDMQENVTEMRRKALKKVISSTPDGSLRYRLEIANDILSRIDSINQLGVDSFQSYIDKYGERASDMYHLINDNEFFAYIMTKEGQADINKLLPETNPVGFTSRVKSYLSDLLEWVFNKLGLVSPERKFAKEVLSKFKSGEFTVERQMFTAGPNLNASIQTPKDLQKAIKFNVRNQALKEEGNVEAARRVSLEAGSFHNLIYDLYQKVLKDMEGEEEFKNMLGKTKFKDGEFVTETDDVFEISKKAASLASVKNSEAIRKILEENQETTNGLIFNAEGYLELHKIKDELPVSIWEQVSKEFFKNTEEFVISYQRLREQAKTIDSESEQEKLISLMDEVKDKFSTKQAARNSVSSFKMFYKNLLEKVKADGAESKALELLTKYGFDLNRLSSQLDDKLVGPEIFKTIENFYNTVWNNADAQIILHKGINREGKEATWRDLVFAYIVEKGLYRKHLKKGSWNTKTMEKVFSEVDPIVKFAADHILQKHKNDVLLNKVSEETLRDSFEAYSEYEQEISNLFATDKEFATRGGKRVLVKVDGRKRAIDKLLKDYNTATGELAVANRLFLSLRRKVLNEIRANNDIKIAAEVAGRIVEHEQFSKARKISSEVIKAKPVEQMELTQGEGLFPHPEQEKSVSIKWDLSDTEGREQELLKLSQYIDSINQWINDPENQDDPFTPAWIELRDHAVATLLGPTIRDGKMLRNVMDSDAFGFRPLQNLLSSVGTFTSKLATTHLDNWALTLERGVDWGKKYEEDIKAALFDAARSHGFQKGPIGVADWRNSIGQRLFALANVTGRLPSVGDVATVSDSTKIKTVTKEDIAALKLQVKAFGDLFALDVKKGRGDVILGRRTNEELKARDKKSPRKFGRRALKDTEYTLPKRFSTFALGLSSKISNILDDNKKEFDDIDSLEDKTDKEKRELKLDLYADKNKRGDSIIELIGGNFQRYVLPFLDNREGRITNGTDPYFTEGVYDEARDAVLNGDIKDLTDLAMFFSNRSVDVTKLGEEEEPVNLNTKESLYELIREMTSQSYKFNKFMHEPIDASSGVEYKKTRSDSPFTTSRQEAVANYFYYEYGSFETATVHNLINESAVQYLDSFIASLKAVAGELDIAVKEKQDAANNGLINEFLEDKKQSVQNGKVFLDYERAENHLNAIQSKIVELEGFLEKDKKFEMQINRTYRRVFGDVVMVAIQLLTTGLVNVWGTATRSNMRMVSMFGGNATLHKGFAVDMLKEIVKGGLTFGVGFTKGVGKGALEGVKTRKGSKVLSTFLDEFLNKPFVEDISLGQFKINSALRRLNEAGYTSRINVQGKIDNYLESVETRGRIEREDELRSRSDLRSGLSTWYNGSALFLAEIPGMALPRIFDTVGNNISFRFANTAMSVLEIRLKDLHRRDGNKIWERYNDPDPSIPKSKGKSDVLTPTDAFGDQFIFKANETSMAQLEEMFSHSAIDYHAEALRFLKELDTNKDATFLTTEQRAQLGIGLVTSENLATVANRPIQTKTQANSNFLLAIIGWSVSAAFNSIQYLSKSPRGKQTGGIDSLKIQLAVVLMGMMTVAAVSFATQEELLRMIYKFLFGEVKAGRQPWEEQTIGKGIQRTLLYGLSGFPMINAPFNMWLNDEIPVGQGYDFFIQNKISNTMNFLSKVTFEGISGGALERNLVMFTKQMYPNSRYLVNRIGPIAGTVKVRDNMRLIRRYAPRDRVRRSNYTGGGQTSSPTSVQVSLMVNYAMLEDWNSFNHHFKQAIAASQNAGDENPVQKIRNIYAGKDAYRGALQGPVTSSIRSKILNSLNESQRNEYLINEVNFYNGLKRIGGRSPRFRGNRSVIPSKGFSRRVPREQTVPFPSLRRTY